MENQATQEAPPLEIVSGDALNAIERGQIDMQIATAKKYPRSIKAFLEEARSMIAVNLDTAEGCNYRLKRKEKDGGMKIIEGPSIRLLEICASAWTNLRYGSRVIGIDQDFVTAQGVAFDLQKNVAVTVETKRSIRSKFGRYSIDMIMVTSNAAGAIARRNALSGVVPRSYILDLANYAKQVAIGDIKQLPERRQRAFEYFTKTLGIPLERVLAYVEKPALEDCGLAELEELQGLKTMLKEGEISLETAFPDPTKEGKDDKPDLGGAKQDKPALDEKKKEETKPAVAATTTAPAASNVVPLEQPAKTTATTTTPPPASIPTENTPTAETKKRTRAPKTPAPAEPPQTEPPAEEKAPDESLSIETLATNLDNKLEAEGVDVDDFFDWCKGSGRDQRYKFDPDKCESISMAPAQLIADLSANGFAGLAPCVKMFGTAAKAKK